MRNDRRNPDDGHQSELSAGSFCGSTEDQCRCWNCGAEYVHFAISNKFGPPCFCVNQLPMMDDGSPDHEEPS